MKNKMIFILIAVFLSANSRAQLIRITSDTLSVNYEKTLHLIFPSNVKYFTSVDEYVVVDNPQETPFILRIKANQKNFSQPTNVSVATADGQFYDFLINYVASPLISNIFLPEKNSINPETILINGISQTHLLFPEAIKYADYGSESIEIAVGDNTQNILRVRAVENQLFPETNVSVVTTDKKFYTFNVRFSQDNPARSYYVDRPVKMEENVILSANELTDRNREQIREKTENFSRNIYSLGEKKDGIIFSVFNVFIHQDMLFFKLSINNRTAIPYEIDYLKFNIIDKKRHKLTATQELEQIPLYTENFKEYILPMTENVFTLGFLKFTIPDQKVLRIDVNEKNGGRHINFNLENKDIINGQTF